MARLYLTFLGFLFLHSVCAQSKQDYLWLFGDDNQVGAPTIFGGSVMDFHSIPPILYLQERSMNIEITLASICDEEGNLLLYSNGMYIANAQHDTIENSAPLLTLSQAIGNINGLNIPQGALLLPIPEAGQKFVLVHEAYKVLNNPPPIPGVTLGCGPLYQTIIDLALNDGAGGIILKKDTLVNDTLDAGKITAVRHANGRDWWVVVPKYDANIMYRFLLTPTGLQPYPPQHLGITLWNGLGQAVFSPDGTRYAHMSLHHQAENYLHIFDFDRCTGLFSNGLQIPYYDLDVSGGVAISPNSRFLYLSSYTQIYQFDLYADDIVATLDTVAVYDNYLEHISFPGAEFDLPTRFFMAQLAPDGKIYLNTTNSVRSLHVINHPDLPGEACEVLQHSVMLPTLNNTTMPNYPNFRLGPQAGSGCDTLQQPPTAAWGYVNDALTVQFTDSSYHDIRTWHWDFGDGATDTLPHPLHTYATDGAYQVCLSVENPRGADTLCRQIEVAITGIKEVNRRQVVQVFPNPTNGSATLKIRLHNNAAQADFILYDALGRPVRTYNNLNSGDYPLDLYGLSSGAYYFEVRNGERRVEMGKLVVLPE